MERHPALVIPANNVQDKPPFLPNDAIRYHTATAARRARQSFIEHESPLSALAYAATMLHALQVEMIDEGFGYPEMWVSGEVKWIGQAPFVAVHNEDPTYQGGEWDGDNHCTTEWFGIGDHAITTPVE